MTSIGKSPSFWALYVKFLKVMKERNETKGMRVMKGMKEVVESHS